MPNSAALGEAGAGGDVAVEGRAATPPGLPSSNLPINPALAKIPILVYHSIAPANPLKPEDKMQLHYRIDPIIFAEQMAYLKNNGYTPITFNTLVEAIINNTSIPGNPVVLTFDDGWRNQYTYAVPVLQQDNFVATFFIITSYVDGNYPAYMSWDQVISLDKMGMEIGSHTVDHVNLATVTPTQVQFEVTTSKAVLEQRLGHSVTTFAYPDYGQNSAVQLALHDAGYVGARGGWGKTPNSINTIYNLKSQEVVNNPDPFIR